MSAGWRSLKRHAVMAYPSRRCIARSPSGTGPKGCDAPIAARHGYCHRLCERLTTPLQFELYLTRSFEEAFRVGQKPVDADTVDDILAPDLDGLEARLTRNGYNAKVLTEMLGARPGEVRAFPGGHMPPERTQELHDRLLAAGMPL